MLPRDAMASFLRLRASRCALWRSERCSALGVSTTTRFFLGRGGTNEGALLRLMLLRGARVVIGEASSDSAAWESVSSPWCSGLFSVVGTGAVCMHEKIFA